MPFERAEQQQPQEGGIHAGPDAEPRDQRKHSAVIALSGGILDRSEQLVHADLFGEDRAIERVLGREMLEDQRFAYSSRLRNLLGRCPVETLGGEE